MDFPLFIALNFLLLVRPEDLFPPIAGLRLYLVTIVLCTVTALPELQRTLSREGLRTRPVPVCVLGMLAATFLSFAFRGRFSDGLDFCGEFAKVVLFFFLLVSVVNTPERFGTYVGWVAVFVGGVAAVTLLQHFEVVEFAGIESVSQWDDSPDADESARIDRAVSVGLFADPNDLCVILAFGMVLFAGKAATARGAIAATLWLLPIVPLAYTCKLTMSRGGVLALLAGVAGWAFARLGPKRAVPFLAVAAPALLFGAGGRQGDLGGGGTAHERLMLWAHGLGELFRMPFHVPTGLAPGFYIEEFGQVAHNSYVNAYVELGVLGGGLFFSSIYIALRMTHTALKGPAAEPWAREIGPFVFAATVAYAAGCYSLTRNFHIPTYLAIGLAATYSDLAQLHPHPRYCVTRGWWWRLLGVSVAGLVLLKFATQLLGALGV